MTQEQIDNNKTSTYQIGDKVEMFNCAEAEFYKNRIWTCRTESFMYPGNHNGEVVFLEGFAGCFLCEYLKPAYPKADFI